MRGTDDLHLEALAAVAVRSWWRLVAHPSAPEAYVRELRSPVTARERLARAVRSLPGLGGPHGALTPHVHFMLAADAMGRLAAGGRLMAQGRSAFDHPFEKRFMHERTRLLASSPGFAATNERYVSRNQAGDWPSDPALVAARQLECWARAEPGVPPAAAILLQVADMLYVVGRAELVRWQVAWGSGAHFTGDVYWTQHHDACRALLELEALVSRLDERLASAMQLDVDRIRAVGPLVPAGTEWPDAVGSIEPSPAGPLGPL